MTKILDLIGQKFGRLTVIEFNSIKNRASYWKCKCDCGTEIITSGNNLRTGHTKSCGCIQKEFTRSINLSHNLSRTKLYNVWTGMKMRCYNPQNRSYPRYGGRGIKVCDEWLNDFKSFYEWAMNNGYADNLSIDRIEVSKGYFPENCRWADSKTQNRNKSNNIIIEYQGENITLAELSIKTGINLVTLYNRYTRGDRGERLFRPVHTKK